MPFAVGENVGPYRIVEKLGQGGMATVYKAYHPSLDRYVALKVLHPAFLEDPNFLARFQREARIVARLDHPHIVPIYDFAEQHGQPYLVMRFVEGETLKAHLQRGPLSREEVMRVLEAVGAALTYAHRQGVLHRDIKPSNIILTPGGQIFLTDFGLARMAEAGETTLSRDMMVGTPQYISPEQARAESQLDARTDVYSLGVVLYEMLVGRVPYQADTPYAIVHDHIFTPLPLPRSLKPTLSEPLERALLKALAKDPADRFSGVAEMVAAFREAMGLAPAETVAAPAPAVAVPTASPEAAVAPAPVAEEPASVKLVLHAEKPARKKRRWPWVVAGVAVLLCFCVGMVLIISNAKQDVPSVTPSPVGPPLPPSQLIQQAHDAAAGGDTDTALRLYEQAVEADPHLVPAYLEAGDLLVREGDLEGGLSAFERGLASNPESAELHLRRAELVVYMEAWEAAVQELTWMQETMPDSASTHAYIALLGLGQGQLCEQVRPEFDLALQIDPQLAWAHYGLALCHQYEDNPEAAQRELEIASEQEGSSPFLRQRIEELADELGIRGQIVVTFNLREFGRLTQQIANEDLRAQFRDLIESARNAWNARDPQRTVQALEVARAWVEQYWDQVGEPLAGQLYDLLSQTIETVPVP